MKALFFSPFANIWDHSFPEGLVAEALRDSGFEITTVRCDGIYEAFCVAMSASGLTATDSPSKKRQVCAACRKRRNLLDSTMSFPSLLIENYVTESDREDAKSIALSAQRETWPSIELSGIPIGRYAAYEFLLNYKIAGTDIPAELFSVYQEQLRISILTMRASERILEEQAPDAVVTYNRLYGVNHAFLAVAEKHGIPTYTLQGGAHVTLRAETMTMFLNSQTLFSVFDKPSWLDYKDRPVGPREIDLVNAHFDGVMEASSAFAYSSAFEASEPRAIREKFGIPDDAPVLLIPMSSEDELNAAQLADLMPDTTGKPNLFEDQFSWIRFLFQFASTRPDYRFILRLHPRMFPNKRENVVAPVVARVMELIKEAPDNVIMNLPTDDVSIYDLIQIVDVLLGYRSTVGAEFAAFGLPVVAPANKDFFTYPNDVNRTGYSEEEYSRLVDESISRGWSIENMRIVYRWFSFLFTRIAVDFSDSVSARPSNIRPKKPGLKLWLWRKMVFLIIQFGPLVRERLALRGRSTSETTKRILADVVANTRESLADSSQWPERQGSLEIETAALRERLQYLESTAWTGFAAQRSLAAKVAKYLEA